MEQDIVNWKSVVKTTYSAAVASRTALYKSDYYYRAMHIVLVRYCCRKSSVRPSVCLSVCLWRWGTVGIYV